MGRGMTGKPRKKYVKRTRAVERAVLKLLATGMRPGEISLRDKMPSERQIYAWSADVDSEFSRDYARVRPIGYARLVDEILDISDDGRNDWMTIQRGDTEIEVPNREVVDRSKLRVDTRKWILSKCLPKVYGERIDVNAKHDASDAFKSMWTALSSGQMQVGA